MKEHKTVSDPYIELATMQGFTNEGAASEAKKIRQSIISGLYSESFPGLSSIPPNGVSTETPSSSNKHSLKKPLTAISKIFLAASIAPGIGAAVGYIGHSASYSNDSSTLGNYEAGLLKAKESASRKLGEMKTQVGSACFNALATYGANGILSKEPLEQSVKQLTISDECVQTPGTNLYADVAEYRQQTVNVLDEKTNVNNARNAVMKDDMGAVSGSLIGLGVDGFIIFMGVWSYLAGDVD